jgi:hypothetical protein
MTTSEMIKLREQGLTQKVIADKAGISQQAVQRRLNPQYKNEYRKTPKYRKYQLNSWKTPKYREWHRHYEHNRTNPSKIFDNCERCLKEVK